MGALRDVAGGAVQSHIASTGAQQPQDGLQKRGLAPPVGAEDGEHRPVRHPERQVPEHRAPLPGQVVGQVLDGDHDQPPAWVRRKSQANIGAPISAVSTPNGISDAVAVRATLSTSTM